MIKIIIMEEVEQDKQQDILTDLKIARKSFKAICDKQEITSNACPNCILTTDKGECLYSIIINKISQQKSRC